MKLALILTNDWELFGDGSGDYFEVQHKPLLEFLDLADKYSAKITIMAEVMQQFSHIKFGFDSIAKAWEDIILKTYKSGSDVQLHLHPQWIDAKYENNEWLLNYDNWVLGKLPTETIDSLIVEGRDYLQKLLVQVNPDYKCNIFRAGAYCIEPSEKVIPILKKYDFVADTSVTKELVTEYFDFTNAPSNIFPWRIGSNVLESVTCDSELFEIPIYSDIAHDSQVLRKFLPALYYRLKFSVIPKKEELAWMDEKEKIKNKRYPKSKRFYKKYVKKDLQFYLKAILSTNSVQLDYDYIPASVFVKTLERLYNKIEKKNSYKLDYLPVVASGHFKDIHNCDNLERIFKGIQEKLDGKVEYWTMTQAAEYLKSKPS